MSTLTSTVPPLINLDQEIVAQARSVKPAQPDQVLVDAARRCVDVYVKVAHNLYGCNIAPVTLTFDLCDRKPNRLGEARSGEQPLISLNMVLYRDYVEKFLNVVIPHEIAHLMQFDKFDNKGFGTQGHGPEWKEAMRRIGQEPTKYSEGVDTSKAVAHYKQQKRRQSGSARKREENHDQPACGL